MRLPRRQFLYLVAAGALPVVPRTVHAQAWPSRTITLIVPFAAGGATDVSARIIAEHMSKTLGQQIVVQNVPGAGGTVGSARAMRAEPDGYTILIGHVGTHAVAVPLYPNLPYKPEIDFDPISLVSEFPVFIAARQDFPANNLKEFVAHVKANADKLNVGHAGIGSVFHISALLLHSLLKVQPTFVPFNGGLPAMTALVAGQVDYLCADATTGAPQLAAGRIKAYAIASAARSPALPDVPTALEAGLPEFQTSAWFGLFAPRGTPLPIRDRLAVALDRALDDASVRQRMQAIGSDLPGVPRRGREPLRALVKAEIARWTPIIQAMGAKVE